MTFEEAKVWLSPVETWVNARAQAEADPDGQWHKTQDVYRAVMDKAQDTWLPEKDGEPGEPPEIDLELGGHSDTAPSESEERGTLPGLPGGAPEGEQESDADEGGTPQLPEESTPADETAAEISTVK